MFSLIFVVLICETVVRECHGHGYLLDPPSRSTMWRWPEFKDRVKSNNDDNALRCAGHRRSIQCGICGDPKYGPKKNEAGGEYATGIISRRFSQGQIIKILVTITASHNGYFEFHLCPNNNTSKPITQTCLDKYPLRLLNGAYHYPEGGWARTHTIYVRLPVGLTCTQCVLQWKYTTNNSPGGDWIENYYGCSDIAISRRSFIGRLS